MACEETSRPGGSVVSFLVLDIGGKTVEVTMDQARELYEALDDLFGDHAPPGPAIRDIIPIRPKPLVVGPEPRRPWFIEPDCVPFRRTTIWM